MLLFCEGPVLFFLSSQYPDLLQLDSVSITDKRTADRPCLELVWLPRQKKHALGVCFGFFVVVCAVALLLVLICNYHEATILIFLAADRWATARTTETLNHAAFRQKKSLFPYSATMCHYSVE